MWHGWASQRCLDRAMPSTFSAFVRHGIALGFFVFAPLASAQEFIQANSEIRSFLGQPLNVRIPIADARGIPAELGCFSIVEANSGEESIRAADMRLAIITERGNRYLQVRGKKAFDEPIAQFRIGVACPGTAATMRDYVVLLDPLPFSIAPSTTVTRDFAPVTRTTPAATTTPPSALRAAKKPKPTFAAANGMWTVRAGDTLMAYARAIYPDHPARQQQYVEALRELNPAVASATDTALLEAGSALRMPDLYDISGIVPESEIASVARIPTQAPTPLAAVKSVPAEKPAPIAALPGAPKADAPPVVAKTAPREVPASKSTSKSAQSPSAAPRRDGFSLRLSNGEIDLSRSRNVTEEQRRQLREKLLVLDADDQLAALLSLRNTVKQLESRLNQMQLKLSEAPLTKSAKTDAPVTPTRAASVSEVATPAARASATPPSAPSVVPEKMAAPVVATVPANANATIEKTVAAKVPPAPAEMQATPPIDTPPAKVVAVTPASATKAASPREDIFDNLPSSTMLAGGGAGLLALIAAWWWSRKRNVPAEAPRIASKAAPSTPLPSAPASIESAAPATEQPWPDKSTALATPTADDTQAFDVTMRLDSPLGSEDAPARFELDAGNATAVDFPLGAEDSAGEDRVRRLQYMYERYPELMTNTVSIDDADSVINAARLYYDEGHREKACEMLTFAVEERPQEIRFWLAQFEIFRLENSTAEFTALAGKFHVLFGHTPAWPKVRHIGHELDPTNPLFAAAGREALAGEHHFDPVAENWLNAPMDFTSEALMAELRRTLFDDHGVDRPDFESITARLAAGAQPA